MNGTDHSDRTWSIPADNRCIAADRYLELCRSRPPLYQRTCSLLASFAAALNYNLPEDTTKEERSKRSLKVGICCPAMIDKRPSPPSKEDITRFIEVVSAGQGAVNRMIEPHS
jgi:hypothetical protein